MRFAKAFILLSLCALAAGCVNFGTPEPLNPGTSNYQQLRAGRFDPYPENDIGPEIVGSRPRDFQKPQDEVRRARWNPLGWMQGLRRGF